MGRTRPLGVAMLALALVAGAASRAQAAGGYAAMDADKDGLVSRDEVLAAGDRAFERLDADRDGYVTKEELLAARKRHGTAATPAAAGDEAAREERATARRERWLERLDSDHDGRVSREEYRAWRAGLFDRLDKDKDGKLSPDELPHRKPHGAAPSGAIAHPGSAGQQS
jgi:Ca2+-binding EF-hand superfamily protein